MGRVHGRLAQLLPIHLAQTLESGHLDLAALVLVAERLERLVLLEVPLLVPERHRVEGGLGDVDVSLGDEVLHLAEEERQQQRADVGPVDVGVGEEDHLVVADLLDLEVVLAHAGTDGGDEGLDLLVLEHLVDAGPLDVEDLPPDGEDRLGLGVAGLLGRTAGAVTLDDEQLALLGLLRGAVGELAGHARRIEHALASGEVAGLAGGHAGPGRGQALLDDAPTLGRVLLEPEQELVVGDLLDQRAHLGVAELGLGLTLELRVLELHRDDGGESFADVLTLELRVLVLHQLAALGVLVHHVGEGLLEALLVHAALGGGDGVGEAVQPLVEGLVPLHRDFDDAAVLLGLEGDHRLVERLLRRVEVLDEVDEAAVVLERLFERFLRSLVTEPDFEALVEEGHLPQPLEEGLGPELGVLEHVGVGPERDLGPGLVGGTDLLDLARGLAALVEAELPLGAVAVDLEVESLRERVDDRDPDAVEASRDLVALSAELPPRVQGGHDHLGGGLVLRLGVLVGRDAAAVVLDAARAVVQDRDLDAVAVPGEGLVDRVVDDFVDEVVEARRAGGADVHTRSLPDRLETLEDGDVFRRIGHARIPLFVLTRQTAEGWASVVRNPTGGTPRTGGARTPPDN